MRTSRLPELARTIAEGGPPEIRSARPCLRRILRLGCQSSDDSQARHPFHKRTRGGKGEPDNFFPHPPLGAPSASFRASKGVRPCPRHTAPATHRPPPPRDRDAAWNWSSTTASTSGGSSARTSSRGSRTCTVYSAPLTSVSRCHRPAGAAGPWLGRALERPRPAVRPAVPAGPRQRHGTGPHPQMNPPLAADGRSNSPARPPTRPRTTRRTSPTCWAAP